MRPFICSGFVDVQAQLRELGRSRTTQFYGIALLAEAHAYWRHPLATRHWHRWRLLLHIGLSPCPRAQGAPDCASADMACK